MEGHKTGSPATQQNNTGESRLYLRHPWEQGKKSFKQENQYYGDN